MTRKDPHAVALGRKGGQVGGKVRSEAKAAAARANGKKGGRPAKVLKALTVLLAAWTIACGSSPTAPTTPPPPVTPPAPMTVTITGHVTATQGGQPLSGVQAALGTTTIITDGSGSFSTSMPPQASVSLALTGASIVPRTIRVAATNTRDVTADAILMGGGFDLTFYRQLVRNGFDAPATFQPLRRWTTNPSIYLRTVDDAGAAIDSKTLQSTEQAIRETVPLWTAGTLSAATIERGTDSRKGVAGWITVNWPSTPGDGGICGKADVGLSGGEMWLYYKSPCKCVGGPEIRPRTVRHELGHAMGFWHTDSANDLMAGSFTSGCDAQPSARELYHARIAYARPVGNVDPDTDASGPVYLSPLRVQ